MLEYIFKNNPLKKLLHDLIDVLVPDKDDEEKQE